MVDLFHAVSECADLVDYWDVAGDPDGVLLRARSRLRYPTEGEAVEAARVMAVRLPPDGYHVREVSAVGRATDGGEPGWHAFAEVLVCDDGAG